VPGKNVMNKNLKTRATENEAAATSQHLSRALAAQLN
jgi:hypothetical protein